MFLNDWQDAGIEGLKQAFALKSTDLAGVEILLASYGRDEYEGEAFVLFQVRGELYEVNASHSSTDGLQGQWEPEETMTDALRYRLDNGRLGRTHGRNRFADELRMVLSLLERMH